MKQQKKAHLYAVAAVLLWSTVATAFKIALCHAALMPLLFCASAVSAVVLFSFLLSSKKLYLLKNLTKTDYMHSILSGLLNPFLYYLALFKAYSILPAQEALTLNFLWPIMLVLLSIPLLRQKIRPRDIAAIIISFAGVFVIATRGRVLEFEFTNITGVTLAAGSSVIWALFWIHNLRDKRDELVKLFLSFAFGSCFILITMILFADIRMLSAKALAGGIYIGLFEMGITFFLWNRALVLAKTTAHVANLIYLVPFLSIVVIALVLREQIYLSTLAGLMLIITGITTQKLKRSLNLTNHSDWLRLSTQVTLAGILKFTRVLGPLTSIFCLSRYLSPACDESRSVISYNPSFSM
jgi:drug/metabolite transporter (DMT)-like permease